MKCYSHQMGLEVFLCEGPWLWFMRIGKFACFMWASQVGFMLNSKTLSVHKEGGRYPDTVVYPVSSGGTFLHGLWDTLLARCPLLATSGSSIQIAKAEVDELYLSSVIPQTLESSCYPALTTMPSDISWQGWADAYNSCKAISDLRISLLWNHSRLQGQHFLVLVATSECWADGPSMDSGRHHHAAHSQSMSWKFSLYVLFS